MYCFSSLAAVVLFARSSFFSATMYRKDAASRLSSACCLSPTALSSSVKVTFSSANFFASWLWRSDTAGGAFGEIAISRVITSRMSSERDFKCFSKVSTSSNCRELRKFGCSIFFNKRPVLGKTQKNQKGRGHKVRRIPFESSSLFAGSKSILTSSINFLGQVRIIHVMYFQQR